LSKYLSKLSRIIFFGRASDGSIHTDQGKQPDRSEQQKQQEQQKTIKTKITIQNHPKNNKKKQKGKETDDEPQ